MGGTMVGERPCGRLRTAVDGPPFAVGVLAPPTGTLRNDSGFAVLNVKSW